MSAPSNPLAQLLWLTLIALAGLYAASLRAEPAHVLRISTENTAEHVQTRAIERFARELEQASDGQIDVDFNHSARLFRDRDVIAALTTGKVEMAVPGMWQLDRYVPDVGLYMLPLFYGRSAQENYRVRDGEVGASISAGIGQDLGLKVLGRWLDLGHAHLYFTDQPVQRHEALAGRRIRIPGGIANRSRLQAFGADPVIVAWPDLPDALGNGQVTGVLTTHETVRSAGLWRNGVRFSFEDRQYFAQYVPLVNADFWARLPDELKRLMQTTWDRVVDDQRAEAAQAQAEAKAALLAEGIQIDTADAPALKHWRTVARQHEDDMISRMGVDPELVRRAEAVLEH
ncbi:TRAP transporter substrate-binding protein DctP [Marinobacterium sp. AK62]|uniref:TRAP transporter substrate-binding protein DctP n=1 Tax=Marinobacterium alkalitolerans TaxID=1542925 RepID=A0ABS3Z8K7_9GAMM|nr:TRAP transporter substrate-binding protein DctP [Marinobacterium alkalitolerans]MBP0048053.1 TRAP transporter substrate-binding protein DctP [Marinobacterium alkalitolerans]